HHVTQDLAGIAQADVIGIMDILVPVIGLAKVEPCSTELERGITREILEAEVREIFLRLIYLLFRISNTREELALAKTAIAKVLKAYVQESDDLAPLPIFCNGDKCEFNQSDERL